MARSAQFAALLLIAGLLGTPAMACLIPGTAMSPAEHACCRHMAQQCGQMRMPASHSCCRTEVQSARAYVGACSVRLPYVLTAALVHRLALPPIASQFSPVESTIEHPPPGFALNSTILKI